MPEIVPLPKELPSKAIKRLMDMMPIETIKTGDDKMDIIVRQLNILAAHADATDAYLDSLFKIDDEKVK